MFLTSQSGRKIRMSAAVKGVLRSNSYHGVESPVVSRVHEQDSSQGNAHDIMPMTHLPETRAGMRVSCASCNKICASFQLWHPSTAL